MYTQCTENNNSAYSEHLHRFCASESKIQWPTEVSFPVYLSGMTCQPSSDISLAKNLDGETVHHCSDETTETGCVQAEHFLDKILLKSPRLSKESVSQPKIPTRMHTVAGTSSQLGYHKK